MRIQRQKFFRPFDSVNHALAVKVCAREQFQVLWAVVIAYAISVMNSFNRQQFTAKHLFHYKAMLKHVSRFLAFCSVASNQLNISLSLTHSTTLPRPGFLGGAILAALEVSVNKAQRITDPLRASLRGRTTRPRGDSSFFSTSAGTDASEDHAFRWRGFNALPCLNSLSHNANYSMGARV